jgi:type IV secretory pathway TraG/TraD family ATPase VirD4
MLLPEEEHLLVLGPTGSGKSSALAIPAILEWPGPVVVTDPKSELLVATLAARRQRGPAAVFAPLMRPSDRWDPVRSVQSSEDALRTAGFLVGRSPEREPFWHDLALQLLHGLLVEASSAGYPLSQLLALLQAVPPEELLDDVSHPVARRLVQGALSGGDRTAMGVVATLVSRLGPYGAEQVAEATSESTFDPAAIASGELSTIFCVVSPPDAPLLRGLVSALLARCWRAIYSAPPRVPVLFVLDEFAQLTFLPELAALVQLGRSQGVRMLLMAQDLASVSATYGADTCSALWSNCRTKLLLPGISEPELLERASKLAGSATLHGSGPGRRGEPIGSHPLMAPDEIRRLGPDRALVIHSGDHPALIRQRRWYEDRRLRRLVGAQLPADQVPRPSGGRPLTEWETAPAGESADPLPWVAGLELLPLAGQGSSI